MKLKVYEDTAGEWRWRLVARNGLTVADSAEGYATRANAKRAASRLWLAMRFDVVRIEVES